ncbi:MAG TPA: acyl-CoA dehydrogenase family protein, partial [Polyangiaceae bacterium]
MRFAFTADTLAVRDAVRFILGRECTPEKVRAAWTSDDGRVPGLWLHLSAVGVMGMLAPQAEGGLGLTEVDLVLVLEDSGRYAVPEPVVDTAALAVPLLRDSGSGELRMVASGERLVAVGLQGTPFVAGANEAHLLLLEHEGEVHVVPRGGVRLTPRPSIDGCRRL